MAVWRVVPVSVLLVTVSTAAFAIQFRQSIDEYIPQEKRGAKDDTHHEYIERQKEALRRRQAEEAQQAPGFTPPPIPSKGDDRNYGLISNGGPVTGATHAPGTPARNDGLVSGGTPQPTPPAATGWSAPPKVELQDIKVDLDLIPGNANGLNGGTVATPPAPPPAKPTLPLATGGHDTTPDAAAHYIEAQKAAMREHAREREQRDAAAHTPPSPPPPPPSTPETVDYLPKPGEDRNAFYQNRYGHQGGATPPAVTNPTPPAPLATVDDRNYGLISNGGPVTGSTTGGTPVPPAPPPPPPVNPQPKPTLKDLKGDPDAGVGGFDPYHGAAPTKPSPAYTTDVNGTGGGGGYGGGGSGGGFNPNVGSYELPSQNREFQYIR